VNFTNATLRGADLSGADLRGAIFTRADLSRACLYQANCEGANFSGADMTMSYGKGTVFSKANMTACQMRRVTYKNCFFIDTDLSYADFAQGFFIGSAFNGAKTDHIRNADPKEAGGAVFVWYLNPDGGPPRYSPAEGYKAVQTSLTGSISYQENAARNRR